MKPLKTLIIVIVATILCFIAMETFAQDNKVTEVTYYFPAESAELTKVQIDSIVSILADNNQIVEVIGYANSLPNLTTNENNISLAVRRADNVAKILGGSFISYQVKPGGWEYRKVVIRFQKGECISDNESNNVDSKFEFNGNPDGNDVVSNNDVNNVNDSLAATNVIVNTIDTIIILDTIYITINKQKEPTSSYYCGNKSLAEVWKEYKSIQAECRKADSYVEKQMLASQARKVRECWTRMYQAYKRQQADKHKDMEKKDVSNVQKSGTRKLTSFKSRRYIRLPTRTRGLNATIWTRLFPWAAC
jgi:hypothetical protein